VGAGVGCSTGTMFNMGDFVGDSEGATTGAITGAFVGVTTGAKTGAFVGATTGATTGDGVGGVSGQQRSIQAGPVRLTGPVMLQMLVQSTALIWSGMQGYTQPSTSRSAQRMAQLSGSLGAIVTPSLQYSTMAACG